MKGFRGTEWINTLSDKGDWVISLVALIEIWPLSSLNNSNLLVLTISKTWSSK